MRRLTMREYVLLVVLAIVTVAILYYSGGAGGSGDGSRDDEIAELIVGEPPVVHLERLSAEVAGYDPQGRNLFKYYTPPPKAAPVVRQTAPPRQAPPPPPPQRTATRAVRPPNPTKSGPKPPPVNFTYLGFLGPKEDKIAVFEEQEGLLLARAGDVVAQAFTVVEFGYESITIGYVDERFKDMTTELKQSQSSRR